MHLGNLGPPEGKNFGDLKPCFQYSNHGNSLGLNVEKDLAFLESFKIKGRDPFVVHFYGGVNVVFSRAFINN